MLEDLPSSLLSSSVAPLLMHSSTFTSFSNGGAQHCTQCSRWGRTNVEYRRITTSFDQGARLSLQNYWSLARGGSSSWSVTEGWYWAQACVQEWLCGKGSEPGSLILQAMPAREHRSNHKPDCLASVFHHCHPFSPLSLRALPTQQVCISKHAQTVSFLCYQMQPPPDSEADGP